MFEANSFAFTEGEDLRFWRVFLLERIVRVPRHKTKELFRLKEAALGPPHASYELVVLRLLYSSTHLLAVCDASIVAYITFLKLVLLELFSSRLYL